MLVSAEKLFVDSEKCAAKKRLYLRKKAGGISDSFDRRAEVAP
jgi:hypothetical protein